MKRVILIPLSIAALFASGCSTASEPPSAAVASASAAPPKTNPTLIEGSWHGHETTPGRDGAASLAVSGESLEFHGAEANDWLKATFSLRDDTNPKEWVGIITDCAQSEYVGKKAYAIYSLENGTLTIAGNEPGNSEIPKTFDAAGSRGFVFKHDP
ncbi:MAG TPA: hypothetical protein VK731_00670 [Candidatus Cybelea sp.]|jgi:uncharacterized protein (TIGR03067 family)|nr:hypothetical protein [Candidatus Cybelea sp.]